MNLTTMRTQVRRDLKDEDAQNYRWTNDELDRHISHALKDFSQASPREQKGQIATSVDSRDIDISSLTNRVALFAVEYPTGKFPSRYQRYSLYQDTVTLLGDVIPDGSNCYVYYGKLHELGVSSTIPAQHEDIVALGAEGYALVSWAAYSINRVTVGGDDTPAAFRKRGEALLSQFRKELKRLKSRLRTRNIYTPATTPLSQSTDWGP